MRAAGDLLHRKRKVHKGNRSEVSEIKNDQAEATCRVLQRSWRRGVQALFACVRLAFPNKFWPCHNLGFVGCSDTICFGLNLDSFQIEKRCTPSLWAEAANPVWCIVSPTAIHCRVCALRTEPQEDLEKNQHSSDALDSIMLDLSRAWRRSWTPVTVSGQCPVLGKSGDALQRTAVANQSHGRRRVNCATCNLLQTHHESPS